jgi:transcriptional regulator with XRE-family HTH domain
MTSFGDNLKKIRAAKNISQGELAELIGMHSTHISRYERDLTQPTLEVIKKIADSLNVSADYLIYGTQEEQAENKIKDAVLLTMFTRVQTLDKSDITCIKSMLSAYILKTDLQQKLAM